MSESEQAQKPEEQTKKTPHRVNMEMPSTVYQDLKFIMKHLDCTTITETICRCIRLMRNVIQNSDDPRTVAVLSNDSNIPRTRIML